MVNNILSKMFDNKKLYIYLSRNLEQMISEELFKNLIQYRQLTTNYSLY
jgi:hypothetical protein